MDRLFKVHASLAGSTRGQRIERLSQSVISHPMAAARVTDPADEATFGRTSSAVTEQGDLRAASTVGRCPTLPM